MTDREKFRKPVLNDISFRGKKQTFYFEIKTFSSTFVHRIFELLFYRAIYWKGRNSKYNETDSVMTKRSRTRGKRRGENKKRRKEKDGPTFVFPFSGPKQVARGRSHTRKKERGREVETTALDRPDTGDRGWGKEPAERDRGREKKRKGKV